MFVKEILDAKKGCVITQNIDGLHHRSGIQEKKIIEVHGNATKAKCLDCGINLDLEPFHKAIHDARPMFWLSKSCNNFFWATHEYE